ncbi:MAG: deoxycytidylate deaminase [Alphaproteobacteria bacterium]|jgi:dCMP deaminase
MNKWQRRFFDLAALVAAWSKDPSSQVGAVIVDDRKRIVSVGFNGLPIGVDDTEDRLNRREIKYELIVHAEANAILTAQRSVAGCTIYVHPYLPCSRCAGAIIQAGIKKVVVEDRPIPERWRENFMLSKTILEEAGVEVEIVPCPEN